MSKTPSKDLWTCPKCGRRFAHRNQWHSCGRYSVEQLLEGKSEKVRQLYQRFVELVESCGPSEIAPAKSRIGFQTRTIFAAVDRLTDGGLDAHVVLRRRLESRRFRRVESVSPGSHVHHFRVQRAEELDEEVVGWLKQAYFDSLPDSAQRK